MSEERIVAVVQIFALACYLQAVHVSLCLFVCVFIVFQFQLSFDNDHWGTLTC